MGLPYTCTVLSLLEAPCAKTSWRALLLRAILGIMGALLVCIDIWQFKKSQQQWNRFWWPPLWFWATRAMFNCACVYEFCKVRIRGVWHFYFVGVLLFCDNVETYLGALLLGRVLLIGTLRYLPSWSGQSRWESSWTSRTSRWRWGG